MVWLPMPSWARRPGPSPRVPPTWGCSGPSGWSNTFSSTGRCSSGRSRCDPGAGPLDAPGSGPMTLRLRLVLALVVLVTAGLALFGVVTYSLYARSQYEQLDGQIRRSSGIVTRQLTDRAGLTTAPA